MELVIACFWDEHKSGLATTTIHCRLPTIFRTGNPVTIGLFSFVTKSKLNGGVVTLTNKVCMKNGKNAQKEPLKIGGGKIATFWNPLYSSSVTMVCDLLQRSNAYNRSCAPVY